MKDKMRVVTLSNAPNRYFPQFLESCQRASIIPDILDPGPYYSPFVLGGVKWKLLYGFLKRSDLDFDYLLFVDSHDLLVMKSLDKIMEAFLAYNAPMVVSAESECWPCKDFIQKHPLTMDPYRFLNSGGILGERDYFASVLEGMGVESMPDHGNDQGQLQIYFCENPTKFKLDTKGALWTSLLNAPFAIELRREGIYNKLTDVYPCMLHGNGGETLTHVVDHCRF